MHRTRVITALILIPLILALILFGTRELLWGTLILAMVLGAHEYGTLILKEKAFREGFIFITLIVGTAAYLGLPAGPVVYGTFILVVILALALYRPGQEYLFELLALLGGLVYIPFNFVHMGLVTELPSGRKWLIFLMAVVFTEDTLAYYTGRSLGKRPLAPRISPKKTVEGALGGLLGSTVVAVILGKFFFEASLPLFAGLGFLLGFIGQCGDLFESIIKRAVGVKDSGRLLPGHGGILDRLDALIIAAPALYYCLKAIFY
ncbi:phosphatidate cytidylyltransferase [Thermosulfuriphilus sp.]